MNDWMYLWAKTDQENLWHPLMWHMIDSASVAKKLWDHSLSKDTRSMIARVLGLSEEQARDLIAYWISLHDFGKGGPGFQAKSSVCRDRLCQLGTFPFEPMPAQLNQFHGTATTWILLEEIWNQFPPRSPEDQFYRNLAYILGGHHGEIPDTQTIINRLEVRFHLGNKDWSTKRADINAALKAVYHPAETFTIPAERAAQNALLLVLAGMTTTADWIASNSIYFPYEPETTPIDSYVELSEKRAEEALKALGWIGWKAAGEMKPFDKMFPFPPKPLQQSFIDQTEGLESPFIVILEAPTGSGKTESALYLSDQSIQKKQMAGMYIAMPTTATSNQIFSRTTKFLSDRYPDQQINTQLIHGSALFNELVHTIKIKGIAADNTGGSESYENIYVEEWFQPKKKSLLAPFGIGTVDQAFLSVMRCRHFFLRLFGLANKVVIFDEVHAYDVYMTEIFLRLLSWLKMINSSVIILSATLPKESRREMVRAFSGRDLDIPELSAPFPRVTISSEGGTREKSLGAIESRSVALHWISMEQLIPALKEKLKEGGNVAVILNRVNHVIECYEQLKNHFPEEELIVFHSRFPFVWRDEIEKKVLANYGKEGKRPARSIVIATQVIEQSLDLDFDLIISALAPVDLLIQRVGRLHRHSERETPVIRPAAMRKPELWLLKPQEEEAIPNFGKDTFIYERYVLARTWFVLKGRSALVLPGDTDELIEKVYSKNPVEEISPEIQTTLEPDLQKMEGRDAKDHLKVIQQLVAKPGSRIIGNLTNEFREEEDGKLSHSMHVLTRNAEPSVDLICILREENGVEATLAGKRPVTNQRKLEFEEIVSLQKSKVSVSYSTLGDRLEAFETPALWKKTAGLSRAKKVVFCWDPLSRQYVSEPQGVVLDRNLGLIVLKKEEGG